MYSTHCLWAPYWFTFHHGSFDRNLQKKLYISFRYFIFPKIMLHFLIRSVSTYGLLHCYQNWDVYHGIKLLSLISWNSPSSFLIIILSCQQICWCDVTFIAYKTFNKSSIKTSISFFSWMWIAVTLFKASLHPALGPMVSGNIRSSGFVKRCGYENGIRTSC